MLRKVIFSFSLFLILHKVSLQRPYKLQVEVFYESLCPDSLKFITQQLYPAFRELSPYIDLKLTPFGKSASSDNGKKFVCQHGPQECRGNRIQSCALSAIKDQDTQVEYVNCFMSMYKKGHLEENGQLCAEAVNLDFNYVVQCYQSSRGTQLQLTEELRTSRVSPKFVPTIVYNRRFSQQLQDASLEDFRQTVCLLISQVYPDACQAPSVVRL